MSTELLRVLLVSHESSVRGPLRKYLEEKYSWMVVETADAYQTALTRVTRHPPNYYAVGVIDDAPVAAQDSMARTETLPGLGLVLDIRQHSPLTEFILYTDQGAEHELEALRHDVMCVSKSTLQDELAVHIRHAGEKRRLKVAVQEKQILEQLTRSSVAMLSGEDLEAVLASILNNVQSVGFDRVRLYKLTDDGTEMEGWAQAGMDSDFVGRRLPIVDDPYLLQLLADPRAYLFSRRPDQSLPFEQQLSKEDVDEWACIPLLFEGKIIGKLSADNKTSRRPITAEAIGPLELFASQAAAAIAKACVHDETSHRAAHLAALQTVVRDISSTMDLAQIAQIACRAVVEQFGVEHSGFLLIDPDFYAGTVVAEYPAIGVRERHIPLVDIPDEQELIQTRQTLIVEDVAARHELGIVRDIFLELNIRSICIVPVTYQDQLFGSFSLDVIGHLGHFTAEQIEACEILADQLGIAIHNAQLFERLEKLRQSSLAMTRLQDQGKLLEQIIELATLLLKAKRGGIYRYYREQGELEIVADYGHKNVKGKKVKVGEGMAGRLVIGDDPYMIVNNYPHWEHRAAVYEEGQPFSAVVEVKLVWQGDCLGVLYVDDEIGRRFTQRDAELLQLFADQAASALAHAGIDERLKRRSQLLDALDEVSRDIHSEDQPEHLRETLTRRAAELFQCRFAGLVRYRSSLEELDLDVVYGLPGHLQGRALPLSDPIIGAVAREGQPTMLSEYHQQPDRALLFEPNGFKFMAAVPLKVAGVAESVLFVADVRSRPDFGKEDLEILDRLAATAVLALLHSRAIGDEQRRDKLELLLKMSTFLQASQDLQEHYDHFLTCVTARFGLRLNRAALFLLDEGQKSLEGVLGIGHFEREEARQTWREDARRKRDEYGAYIALRREGPLPLTPVGRRITGLRLPLSNPADCILSRVAQEGHYQVLTEADLTRFPTEFVQAFEPALPGVVVALRARGEVMGVLIADNKFNGVSVTRKDLDLLLAYTNAAAVAIDNLRLLQESQTARTESDIARERLNTFFKASNALVLTDESREVLELAVRQARQAASAQSASFIVIDEINQVREYFNDEVDSASDIEDLVQTNGYSVRVMQTGEPVKIEDVTVVRERLVPGSLWQKVKAAVCLPVSLGGRRIGVMWLHYDRSRQFPEGEIEALQLYANATAIAYDNARRVKELEALWRATASLVGKTEPKEVLQTIVDQAYQALGASSTFIWHYDPKQRQFIPLSSVKAGYIPDDLWKDFQKMGPRPGGTTDMVLEQEWVSVEDIEARSKYTFLGDNTYDLLRKIGAKSFQGVALKVGDKKLGVLYVNYARKRRFTEAERRAAESFANQAAAALQAATLQDRLRRAQRVLEQVARVTTLGELGQTLDAIVQGTQDVTGCDAVVLYPYDWEDNVLSHRPTMLGVKYPKRAQLLPKVREGSIVWSMLHNDNIYIAPDVSQDPYFSDRRFARDERVKTAAAIPLRFSGKKVGVMFVNYCHLHPLSDRDLQDMELFANQAAIAIYNTHLYAKREELERQKARAMASTALAIRSIESGLAWHTNRDNALVIKEEVGLLDADLGQTQAEGIQARLARIVDAAEEILDKARLPDDYEGPLDSVPLNAHVSECLSKLWTTKDYHSAATWQADFNLPDEATVRANPKALANLYELLVQNSIVAMEGRPVRIIRVSTRLVGTNAELSFSDTGRGIPDEVLNYVFKAPIPKELRGRGAGKGLMLAWLIVQSCEGEIQVAETSSSGTTITLSFPLRGGETRLSLYR